MITERVSNTYIAVTDNDGDRLEVSRYLSRDADYPLVLSVAGTYVGVDLDDGLALLSFLADALGVERFVPGMTPLGDIADT